MQKLKRKPAGTTYNSFVEAAIKIYGTSKINHAQASDEGLMFYFGKECSVEPAHGNWKYTKNRTCRRCQIGRDYKDSNNELQEEGKVKSKINKLKQDIEDRRMMMGLEYLDY